MDYRNKLYKKYHSTHTGHLYAEQVGFSASSSATWERYFAGFFPQNKEAAVLDIGCGSGDFITWMNRLGYTNTSGIDISEEQIALAKKFGAKHVEVADLLSYLPKHKKEFDVIIARDVLEHLTKEEVLGVLENIYGALKDGGVFIAQTVNAKNWMWGRLRYGDFTHELAFTQESISQILRAENFSDIKIYSQRPVVHGIFSCVRWLAWMLFEYLIKIVLFIETGTPSAIVTQNLIVAAWKK